MEITKIITFNPSYLLETNNLPHRKLESLFSSSDPTNVDYPNDDFTYDNHSSNRTSNCSISNSPPSTVSSNSNPSSKKSSPWIHSYSYVESPWAHQPYENKYGLIGSLFIEEGHIYSIAAARDLLFTGSECKNVRVWKNLRDYSEFKSRSGMVKAIVVFGEKIFTGHPDGKIRVWTFLGEKRRYYNHDGNLPKTQDLFVKSLNPINYVKVRSKRKIPWLKHYDTVSCMSVDAVQGLLYSGSWDKTVKVWRISDSKCLESIPAHDDAVNSVVTASEGLVFTGSADGTVKAWRREFLGKQTKHLLVATLLKKESAVTALVVSHAAGVVYGGSSDGLVRFWQVEKRLMAYGGVLRGHKMAVLCLVTGGKLVMSGSADKSICVWRRGDGGWHACMAVLTGHCAPVKCLAVVNETSAAEEEGHPRWIVYSGSLDKSVKIWRVSE